MYWGKETIGPVTQAIYMIAALLPAFLLMRYIYRRDKAEPEPLSLVGSLLIWGVVSAFLAIAVDFPVEALVDLVAEEGTVGYALLDAFVVAAAVEEGAKLFVLRHRTWRNPNFNYRFDAIVYAAAVSLGFAGYENLLYVFNGGLSIALTRAILSIPGHLCFAVFMGLWYGRAKLWERSGDPGRARRCMCIAYLLPVLLHGIYDACLMVGSDLTLLIFPVFVLALDLLTFRSIRHESKWDQPI